MKPVSIFTVILLFFTFYSSAQTLTDKKKIYKAVIETIADNQLPIINETLTRIYKGDIDGDYNKWFYKRDNQKSSATSQLIGSTICVNPIEYSQTVLTFLQAKNIATKGLINRADNTKLDSLNNYISTDRIVSWKKAPLANSTFGNIFKKKRAIGISSILFDDQNKIALVKVQVYSKNKLRSKNPSKIVILQKAELDWTIIGSLDEKVQT